MTGIPNESLPYKIRICTPIIFRYVLVDVATGYEVEGSSLKARRNEVVFLLHTLPYQPWFHPIL
jgi:hypothetical protein